MTTIASQINRLMVVYSTVYSDADKSKHQSSASQAFVWEIHRDRLIPHTKGQLRGKCFYLMTLSWILCASRKYGYYGSSGIGMIVSLSVAFKRYTLNCVAIMAILAKFVKKEK